MPFFHDPPDPRETAAAQTGTNVSTAIANAYLNNMNQVTPYGRKVYNETGSRSVYDPASETTFEVPTFTQKTELSRHGRNLRRLSNQTERNLGTLAKRQSGRLNHLLSKPMNTSGLPQAGDASGLSAGVVDWADPASISSGEETRARVEKALMDRMNPELSRDRETLRTQLSNQGIKLGSEAFDRGMADFGRQSNDARLGAIISAGQEARNVHEMDMNKFGAQNSLRGQQFNENLTGFNAANTSRDRALTERTSLRNQPINEIMSLMSGSQVQMPTFGSTPVSKIPTTDYAGLVNNAYGQEMGQFNQIMGGLFGLGSAGIKAV